MKHVVIIGNGVAGITAARHIRKGSDFKITVISSESDHFFSRTALMYIYMGHMRYEDTKPYADDFWAKNRIDLVRDFVEEIDSTDKILRCRQRASLSYDVLIVATGSQTRYFDWPGQDLAGVQGLYGLPDLAAMERDTRGVQRAVVLGGGLIGIEMVEMLHTRRIPTTFLVREKSYFDFALPAEESAMINDEIRAHHVDLRLGTEMKAVLGDAAGRARAVVTSHDQEISCQFVGIATGVVPNVSVVARSEIETNRGVLVNAFFETNIPDVYAIGDCAEFREDGIGYRRIDPLWYTGRQHGKVVARIICGDRDAYQKPPYFNSAKFFTIEYQTYGQVDAQPPAGVVSDLWQHPKGKQLVRVNYRTSDGRVLGFNLLGVRFRHAVCERWLLEERTIDYVRPRLGEANFDPEFAPRLAMNRLAINRLAISD
ncbi:MAG: FAD-dependent oxidoreductase [Rhodothermales bacterium]|nr:FAD-dependent oxidoreductase [Rhodothermales bacterium]